MLSCVGLSVSSVSSQVSEYQFCDMHTYVVFECESFLFQLLTEYSLVSLTQLMSLTRIPHSQEYDSNFIFEYQHSNTNARTQVPFDVLAVSYHHVFSDSADFHPVIVFRDTECVVILLMSSTQMIMRVSSR